MKSSRLLSFYPWLIWLIAALFYSYEFFLRISPETMTSNLMQSFSVDATDLGILSAAYYNAYALMQIPVGILLDYVGMRRLLSLAALIVAIGCLLFAMTHHLNIAILGRVLMGLGSAFAFIGCLKLIHNWFDNKLLALVIGLTNTLGVLGAIFGEAPLAFIIQTLGWREVLSLAAATGIIVALLIFLIIRDNPSRTISGVRQSTTTPKHLWDGLQRIVKSRQTWLVSIVGGLMVAPIAAFTELWSVSFLTSAHHVDKPEAALLTSVMFIGIAIGGPIHGYISGLIGRRKPVMWLGACLALLCLSCIIYLSLDNLLLLTLLLFMFGFFTSSMLLCFALNSEWHPTWATGVAIGGTNMIVMLGGNIFQPLVGHLLDSHWQGTLVNGVRLFSLTDYRLALSVLPMCLIMALFIIPFIKETYCCMQNSD